MKLVLKSRVARTQTYVDGHMVEISTTGDVEVTIDEVKIANWYAANALRNKTGRAQTLSGMVKAKVLRRDPPQESPLW